MASETMRNSIQERGFARKTMEFEHSKIHDGRGYDVDIEFTLTGTTSLYYHLETGIYNCHLKDFELTTNKPEVKAWLYVNPTVAKSTSPQQVTIYNSDHTSNNTSSLKIYTNSTVTADGTKRKVYYVVGSTGVGQTMAGSQNSYDMWEFITKKNENYLLKIQRIVADGDTTGLLRLKYYEETPTGVI
jgi:hypothetical protein